MSRRKIDQALKGKKLTISVKHDTEKKISFIKSVDKKYKYSREFQKMIDRVYYRLKNSGTDKKLSAGISDA